MKPLAPELVAEMYAEYQAGISMAALAQRYGKHRKSLCQVFARRGLALRPCKKLNEHRSPTGQFEPAKPLTERQITALIAEAPKLAVPVALKLQWRKWSLERRGQFIARLRAKLKNPKDRPQGNKNNFAPRNLQLVSRNQICRQNHAAALFQKSREVTSILLARAQRKGGARRRTVSLKELRHA
jgi:hypothetical protein